MRLSYADGKYLDHLLYVNEYQVNNEFGLEFLFLEGGMAYLQLHFK